MGERQNKPASTIKGTIATTTNDFNALGALVDDERSGLEVPASVMASPEMEKTGPKIDAINFAIESTELLD